MSKSPDRKKKKRSPEPAAKESASSITRLPLPEREDLRLALICAATIVATWIICLGWTWSKLIYSADGLVMGQPIYRDLMARGGDWTQFIYSPDILGGIKLHDIVGAAPLFSLCGKLGLSAVSAANLLLFLIQFCFSFLVIRAARDLASRWGGKDVPQSSLSLIGCALLVGFAPALSWRLGHGHENLLLGLFTFLVTLSLAAAIGARRLTFTLMGIATVALLHGIPSSGKQIDVYGLVFGFPILLAVLLPLFREMEPKSPRSVGRTLLPGLLMLAALAISAPHMAGMTSHARGPDAGRAIQGVNVTYSYITATFGDWLGSIPWARGLMFTDRGADLHHEINYPFGPVLLLLFLVPWRKARALGTAVGLSVVAAVLFSMNAGGFGDVLTSLVPVLKAFRVPERAIYPGWITLLTLAMAGLLHRFSDRPKAADAWIPIAVGGLILTAGNDTVREAAVWLIAAAACWGYFVPGRFRLAGAAVTVLLGLGSVWAFQERLEPFHTRAALDREPAELRNGLLQQAPSLEMPLNRVALNVETRVYPVNASYAAGVSALDGYYFPVKRFVDLTSALEGKPPSPLTVFLRFGVNSPEFRIIAALYNVTHLAEMDKGRMKLSSPWPTAGAAWFSGSLVPYPSLEVLARQMTQRREVIPTWAHEEASWIQSDPAFEGKALPASVSPDCRSAQLLGLQAERHGQVFSLKTRVTAECPLTISMNFVTNLKAFAMKDGKPGQELRVFPAYGALTGVLVPAGTEEVRVEAVPFVPLAARVAQAAGWLLLLGLGWVVWVNRSDPNSMVARTQG